MGVHATVDAAGRLSGFYDDRLHPALPAAAIALSEAQYERWLGDQTLVWRDGDLATAAPAKGAAAKSAAAKSTS